MMPARSWVEIDLSRLPFNLALIRQRLPPATQVIAVVKANAYGHGMEAVSRALLEAGVKRFAVATGEEGCRLRRCLARPAILVFGGCPPGKEEVFRHHSLTPALFATDRAPVSLPVEVQIDTGMARLGIPWRQARGFLSQSGIHITGVYSHLASADSDPEFTRLQLSRFQQATRGCPFPRHIANSAGLAYPEAHLEAVRPGLALYGVAPSQALSGLKPLLCWKTRVVALTRLDSGEPVGYGGTFRTQRPTRVGILGVGYADGYRVAFSNRARVRVGSRLAPVIGRVTMDLTQVDLTDLPQVGVGEEVTLLEADPDSPISAAALARLAATIPYEILTGIGPRVERLYRTSHHESGGSLVSGKRE